MKINKKKIKIPLMKNNNNDNINSMFFNDRMKSLTHYCYSLHNFLPQKSHPTLLPFPFQSMMMIKKERINK
jgi:hypothetical protein